MDQALLIQHGHTQVLLFLSPILYSVDAVPAHLRPVIMSNPMAGIIHAYRQVTINAEGPNLAYLSWSAAAGVLLLVAGLFLFRRIGPTIADRI